MTAADVETWRPVPGYGGRYEVSDHGRVRSWVTPERAVIMAQRTRRGREPYRRVNLSLRGQGKRTREVHALVLQAFVGPCPAGLLVRHLDGKHGNNRLDNLLYGTQVENMADALRHGTATIGVKNAMAKFDASQVRAIRDELAAGTRPAVVARRLGVHYSTVGRIGKGERYASVA